MARLMWAGPPCHSLPVRHECAVARLASPPGHQSCNSSYCGLFNKDFLKLNKTTETYVYNKPVCLADTRWTNDGNFQICTMAYLNALSLRCFKQCCCPAEEIPASWDFVFPNKKLLTNSNVF